MYQLALIPHSSVSSMDSQQVRIPLYKCQKFTNMQQPLFSERHGIQHTPAIAHTHSPSHRARPHCHDSYCITAYTILLAPSQHTTDRTHTPDRYTRTLLHATTHTATHAHSSYTPLHPRRRVLRIVGRGRHLARGDEAGVDHLPRGQHPC